MTTETPESVTLVPIDQIEVLNSRGRNMKVFEEIVEIVRSIGLKSRSLLESARGPMGRPPIFWSAVRAD